MRPSRRAACHTGERDPTSGCTTPADPRTRAALRAVLTVLAVMAVLFAAVVLMLAYGPAR